jgi:hypothetical protein
MHHSALAETIRRFGKVHTEQGNGRELRRGAGVFVKHAMTRYLILEWQVVAVRETACEIELK